MLYFISLTLTTYWAQDIFDEALQIKLKRILEDAGNRNPFKTLRELHQVNNNMSAKQRSFDMI